MKAVLLYNKDWTMKEIADALMVSFQTVSNHIEDYKKLLKPERGGWEEKLSKERSEHLETHLQENIYLRVKDIQVYVMNVMGVNHTVLKLNNWLRKHGFRYKKPEVVPGKANKQKQEKRINNYEKLRENLPPNETIGFMDGVHQ